MMKAKQPVSVAGIEFDALIDQTIDYNADVPEYVTEKGFSVSDNVSLKPEELSMTLYVTDTPVTWKYYFGYTKGRTEKVIKQLQGLYFAKEPVTVITSDTVYENMAITSISISKSADVGYAREIPIKFKKVIVTESKTTKIPSSYGKSGKSKKSAGTANKKTGSKSSSSGSTSNSSSTASTSSTSSGGSSSSGKKSSILYSVASKTGLLK